MPDPQFTIEPPATPQFTIEPPARPAKPGALSRLGTSAREAVGIPADPLQDIAGGAQFAAEHPGEAAKQLALSPIEAYKSAVSQQYDRMHDAYKRGDYGQALVHGLYYLLSPIGGANLGKAAEQIRTGDIAGATGTTLGTALPIVAGSPEVRGAAGAAANATRSAVATGLEKGAKPVSTLATVAAVGNEVAHGRVGNAAAAMVLGKPAISKTMTSLADFIRPGENVKPLPKSFATIHDLTGFLNSPGIEGEAPAPAAAKTAGRPTPTTWSSATYEPIYLKAAKEALPNASDKEVAAEAAKLQAHDEHVAGILKESSDALKAAARPSPFQETPPTFTLATKAGVPVNDVLMKVDPRKLDAALPRDSYYVAPGGVSKSSSPAAYNRAKVSMQENPTTPVEAPRVTIDAKGNADFIDGRNHFAVLRDAGVPEVQVSVPPDQVGAFEKHLGAVRAEPVTPSNMAGYYGEYSGKSNLAANKRQLASPTGSTAPVPKPKPKPVQPFSLGSMKNYYTGTLGELK